MNDMRANLLFRGDWAGGEPETGFMPDALLADLELHRILESMADGDKVVYDACENAILRPLHDADAIRYRQAILADARENPDAVRRLYEIASMTDNIEGYFLSPTRLAETFANAVELLKIYTKLLAELREVTDKTLPKFQSEGFRNMLTMFQRELTDEFFSEAREHISEMKNVDNILISAKLGRNLQSVNYALRRKEKGYWLRWHLSIAYTADAEKHPEGLDDIKRRRERAINKATNVLAQSAEYLKGFFAMLRRELAFYIGCLNLIGTLGEAGMTVCVPALLPVESTERVWRGMYDVSLVLTKRSAVIGNDLESSGKSLFVITGANQGGKSTFLRSIGQAQLMAQCGMPVGAEGFSAPIRRGGVYTHFIREEEGYMRRGKLDEELDRMSKIADHLERGSMLLFNESFASTNEREGSEICGQITRALVENGMEVFTVTHLYTFAASFHGSGVTQYLLAQRRDDAERTFKILPGEPLETAFGEDLYQKIFIQAGKNLM
jgi:DNA mismatch repair ATPase MutS